MINSLTQTYRKRWLLCTYQALIYFQSKPLSDDWFLPTSLFARPYIITNLYHQKNDKFPALVKIIDVGKVQVARIMKSAKKQHHPPLHVSALPASSSSSTPADKPWAWVSLSLVSPPASNWKYKQQKEQYLLTRIQNSLNHLVYILRLQRSQDGNRYEPQYRDETLYIYIDEVQDEYAPQATTATTTL